MRTSGDCGGGARGSLPSANQPRGEPVRMRHGLMEINAGPGEILAPDAASDRVAVSLR